MNQDSVRCVCARHGDGSVTTSLCPLHAEQDPCLTMARVTGKRRRGSVVRGVCSACKWSARPAAQNADSVAFTTEQVAWEQSIPVGQLLDSHFSGRDPGDLSWAIVDVLVSDVSGDYEPKWYYEDEGEYMAALTAAIDAGDVPEPAFIQCGDGYDHADGAHRLVVALHRGEPTIRAYVATCTVHEQNDGSSGGTS